MFACTKPWNLLLLFLPKLRLQESPMTGKPLVGNLLVLTLSREEVQEVDNNTWRKKRHSPQWQGIK
jgi:hypothetical protein